MSESFEGFHDAELVAIQMDRHKKSLLVRFLLPNAEERRLTAEGVVQFRANDFLNQNVVSRVIDTSVGSVAAQEVRDALEWVTSLTDATTFASVSEIAKLEALISNGQLTLLRFEPSRGVELVVVAKSFRVEG